VGDQASALDKPCSASSPPTTTPSDPTAAWVSSRRWRDGVAPLSAPDRFGRGQCSAGCTTSTTEQRDHDGLLPSYNVRDAAEVAVAAGPRPVAAPLGRLLGWLVDTADYLGREPG
jgi:hypothetical protein